MKATLLSHPAYLRWGNNAFTAQRCLKAREPKSALNVADLPVARMGARFNMFIYTRLAEKSTSKRELFGPFLGHF